MSALFSFQGSYAQISSSINKLCCLCCSFIGVLCILCSSVRISNFRGLFYISVTVFSSLCLICQLTARLLLLWQHKFYNFNVPKYEAYLQLTLALAVFVTSATVLSLNVPTYSTAAFFGFLAFGFYVIDAYFWCRQSNINDASTQTDNSDTNLNTLNV